MYNESAISLLMYDETALDVLFWACLVLSLPLMIISTMAVGKHFAELQYQIARHLNGIRWIQSWINLRIHVNRVFFAIAFFTTSILGVVDVDYLVRTWVGRVLFFLVLLAFTISAVLDWIAEGAQLQILLKYEDVNNVSKMRVNIHALNNKLTELYGVFDLDATGSDTINRLQDEIRILVLSIQQDLHTMDPSYKSARSEGDTNARK